MTKHRELVKQINDSEAVAKAGIAYLVKNFDPAHLFHIEQVIDHGISLATEWLPKYKFKDWKVTETKKNAVSQQMKKERAVKIAQVLGDAQKWHSHGRGISMKELSGPEIKLKIDNFTENKELSTVIRHYHGLCVDYYTNKTGIQGYIHSPQGMRRVL